MGQAGRSQGKFGAAERDVLTLGIALAAIIMFVGTGGSVLPQVVRAMAGTGDGPDRLLVNALLINIALIIFGWRRYRDLTAEIQARRAAEERATLLASTDPLTGCLNRRSAGDAAVELLTRMRAKGRTIVAFMIDLDNFKQINDAYGHNAGDEVLQTTAERLRKVLPQGSVIARLGGDEFSCAIPFEFGTQDRVDALLNQVILAISQPVTANGNPVGITVSVGLAAASPDATDAQADVDMVMHWADIAMYHAKKQGKNRHCWFEAPMEDELRLRSELETAVREGLRQGEFKPYYEQQVDLTTGELVGFEMLARWDSPKLGMVSPEVFIPVAEDMGVIGDLSETLIRQALADAGEWDPRLTLSVNISPVQLRDPWLSQKLVKLLVEANFPARRLDIEITESCLHENIDQVRTIISSLRNQGACITLDDFGTGYASLAQLRSLPFDRLKIDRSFIGDLKNANGSDKIVNAIVALGEGLDLPITAEGIEDGSVLESLKGFGRLKGQGYHYGRPEDAGSVRQRLREAGLLRAGVEQADPETEMPARKAG